MEVGFTFKMKVSLTFPLIAGTMWELVEEPEEKEDIPKYKSTALFNKLLFGGKKSGLKLAKPNDNNTIRLSQQAIERYLRLDYIEEWKR